jgi:hypothetical protein
MAWKFCHIAHLKRYSCRLSRKSISKSPWPPFSKGEKEEGMDPIDFVIDRKAPTVIT